MIRVLTEAEKRAICHCLKAEAERLDLRAEAVLSRKREDWTAEGRSTEEDKLDIAARKRATALTKAADGLANLGDFIARYLVTVDCIVILPEQL